MRLLRVFSYLCIPLFAWAMIGGASSRSLKLFLLLATLVVGVEAMCSRSLRAAATAAVLGCCVVLWEQLPELFRYYPVIASLVVAAAFIGSYWEAAPLVVRIAEKCETNLPPHAYRYCRGVNHFWSVLLLVNTLIVLWLAQIPDGILWSWYTGVWSYLLFAVVFAGEYALRQCVRKRWELPK